MNFLEQCTPLTPKKKRSFGLFDPADRSKRNDVKASSVSLTSSFSSSVLSLSMDKEKRSSPSKLTMRVPNTPSKSPSHSCDRYIANREDIDFDYCHHELFSDACDENGRTSSYRTREPEAGAPPTFHKELIQGMSIPSGKRMLQFSPQKARGRPELSPMEMKKSQLSMDLISQTSPIKKKKSGRVFPSAPSKILDAPDLVDDYYLNLLSWGANNVIAIALHSAVYLFHVATGKIDQIVQLEEDNNFVTSVQWHPSDNLLSVGTNTNTVELWDSTQFVKVRELAGHTGRVSSLSWNSASLLSSGGRDSAILNHDIRQSRHVQSTYLGHTQEVCGLSWSPDGSTLASGGNENLLCLWDAAMSSSRRSSSMGGSLGGSARVLNQSSSTPRFQMSQHNAAVKALAWCPWQRQVLASGGGTADRTIRLWNCNLGTCLSSFDTGSQVCAMQWSESHRELVSSHGFSDNQLCLWNLTSMDKLNKIGELKGHTARVLHLAKSPDGTQVASAGADESLRFWDLFCPNSGGSGCTSPMKGMPISDFNNMKSIGGVGGLSMSAGFSIR